MKRAAPAFPWHWEDTLIAGRWRALAVASDPEGMLIDACRRQDAGEQGVIDPFWATTWRAAAGLDRYLDARDLRGTDVLEVGCGTGHAGIAAALRGGRVTWTDGVGDPLKLVRHSLQKNGLVGEVEVLRLGIDRLQRRFPLILGSDVTYLRELWPQLLTTASDHLDDSGQLLLSDPYRLIGNEFRDWLRDSPAASQWRYQEHSSPLPDAPDHPIRVMTLTPAATSSVVPY